MSYVPEETLNAVAEIIFSEIAPYHEILAHDWANRIAPKIAEYYQQAQWQPIANEVFGIDLVLIGRWNGFTWEYVHAAYKASSFWFLPFDSDRTVEGTPALNDDEQPTHWQPLTPPKDKETV